MGKGGRGEWRLASGDRSGRREERRGERDRDGRWVGPLKRECSYCAQAVLLVATAEDTHPKVRTVEMSEY